MPVKFARRTTSRKPRRLLFLPELEPLLDAHLTEHSTAGLPGLSDTRWKTVRLRPEVDTIVAALTARYRATFGVDLSVSEVLAAALILALPVMTSRQFSS